MINLLYYRRVPYNFRITVNLSIEILISFNLGSLKIICIFALYWGIIYLLQNM